MSVNVITLSHELEDAGLPVFGVRFDGTIFWNGTPTSEQLSIAVTISAAHDPTEWAALAKDGSEEQAESIPNWAAWTESQAESWWQTNIQDVLDNAPTVTTANVVAVVQNVLTLLGYMSTMLWAITRLAIAIRNNTFPRLQNH